MSNTALHEAYVARKLWKATASKIYQRSAIGRRECCMAAIEKVPDASRSTSGIKLCWVQKCTETTTDADGSISYCSRFLRCSFSWSPVFLNLLSWISSVLVLWFSFPTFVRASDVHRKQPTNNSWLAVDAVGNGIEKGKRRKRMLVDAMEGKKQERT